MFMRVEHQKNSVREHRRKQIFLVILFGFFLDAVNLCRPISRQAIILCFLELYKNDVKLLLTLYFQQFSITFLE